MTQPGASLECVEVSKRFGRVQALERVSLAVYPGEVHGLLGENGAGKSTLVSILAGLERPDSGELRIDGGQLELRSPRAALEASIGVVHQHFKLVPALSALDNVALASGSAFGWGRLDKRAIRARCEEVLDSADLNLDLDARVSSMSVGARQRVEILKLLYGDPRFLVLDEPTAVLSPPEVDGLFATLRALADSGRTVLLVAHKLDEVLSIADRATVLRGGRAVFEAPRATLDTAVLTEAMVGQAPIESVGSQAPTAGATVAHLAGVAVESGGRRVLADVDLEVRAGEIVAVAGVEGNGQRELALVLAGVDRPTSGSVRTAPHPGFIPQGRLDGGLVGDFSLAENVALGLGNPDAETSNVFLNWPAIERDTQRLIDTFDVRSGTPDAAAWTLSGGNQQKVVIGRELARSEALLVAENPTRGLDIAATIFVRNRLVEARRQGLGIVLISTDLDEVLALGDRVFVLVRGRLTPVPQEDLTRDGIGRLMLAGSADRRPM